MVRNHVYLFFSPDPVRAIFKVNEKRKGKKGGKRKNGAATKYFQSGSKLLEYGIKSETILRANISNLHYCTLSFKSFI